jgi:prepilin-type N-terminal cleavage/methylation domain-containing protein
MGNKRGFTLIEITVVIFIILLVSVLTLPTILTGLRHRQVSEAARLMQAVLAGARDAAARDGAPTGIRLLPDPVFLTIDPNTGKVDPSAPLASSRMIPLTIPPNHSDGRISVFPDFQYPPNVCTVNGFAGVPCLVVEETPLDPNGLPNEPTSWFWNIRIGEKIQIASHWYTIVGPMFQINPELFVNIGPAGAKMPPGSTMLGGEFLLLVNGQDDNHNGWIDEGFDGVDNDGVNGIDDAGEWEIEMWLGGF